MHNQVSSNSKSKYIQTSAMFQQLYSGLFTKLSQNKAPLCSTPSVQLRVNVKDLQCSKRLCVISFLLLTSYPHLLTWFLIQQTSPSLTGQHFLFPLEEILSFYISLAFSITSFRCRSNGFFSGLRAFCTKFQTTSIPKYTNTWEILGLSLNFLQSTYHYLKGYVLFVSVFSYQNINYGSQTSVYFFSLLDPYL